jgi:transglutaminase-like putative cysteine protease
MQIRAGFDIVYECPQPTPMILTLNVHFTRVSDLVGRDDLVFDPPIPVAAYRDGFGNWCTRIVAPAGRTRIRGDAVLNDSGQPDTVVADAQQLDVPDLPEETLVFLLGSRYCETDRLSDIAWSLFGASAPGWARVQAICDYVHRHIAFGYHHARKTRSALEAYYDRTGVCRDYAHLAVAFCRCMNIPARYCTGYLGEIGVPPPHGSPDFAAWFEAFLGGRWHTFDARNNVPRIGRVLIARGRDASDVAISNSFGANELVSFSVWTDEVDTGAVPAARSDSVAPRMSAAGRS